MLHEAAATPDFNVFAASSNGVLKCLSITGDGNVMKNFGLCADQQAAEVTCLEWGVKNEESELLLGLASQTVRVFNTEQKSFTNSISVPGGQGPLCGVARCQGGTLVTAAQSGTICVWKPEDCIAFDAIDLELAQTGKMKRGQFGDDKSRVTHLEELKAGRHLSRMVHCHQDENIIATGGKESSLQIWDLNHTESPVFVAKNVKHDMLDLRVPVFISDICFPDPTASSAVATVSKYGHVRLYDRRINGQRRPVHDFLWQDEVLTAASAVGNRDQILVGSGQGSLALYDFRAKQVAKGMLRKYRDAVGGVRSISSLPEKSCFAAVGLDRFLRIYSLASAQPIRKVYLKSKLNCVLLGANFDPASLVASGAVREGQSKRRRASDHLQPEASAEGRGDEDEHFWAKIPVIRDAKKNKKAAKSRL